MNYHRIYNEFIADRKLFAEQLEGYTENHHILPRALGGGDEPENLIRLTPEDHFFAHLLLAKTHNTRPMWGALMLMMGSRHAGTGRFAIRRKATKYRSMYGSIRKAYSAASKGLNGANADLNEYEFYHFDGRSFAGTRIDFGVFSGVPYASVDQMVRGDSEHCYGWSLCEQIPEWYDKRRTARAVANGKMLRGFVRNPQLYCFYSEVEQRSVITNQRGLLALGMTDKSGASALCNGSRYVSNGWCLLENADWAFDRSNNRGAHGSAYSEVEHHFVNCVSGEDVTATSWKMGKLYSGGDSRCFSAIVSGAKKGWRGWHLKGTPAPMVKGKVIEFYHPVEGVFRGTVGEMAGKAGVTQPAVSHHIAGKSKSIKGGSFHVEA